MDDLNGLIRLKKNLVKLAGKMLARAFINEPYEVYCTPDEIKRRKRLTHAFTFVMKYGVRYGKVYTTSSKLEGIAGWLPSRNALGSFWKAIRTGAIGFLFRVGIGYARKQLALQKFFDEKEKRHAPFPHYYLAPLGVDPEFQKQGYASKLMKPMLAWLDENQSPSYLETELEKNFLMY